MTARHHVVLQHKSVTAFGPATLSNLGPGFDTIGLCIQGWGDRITASPHAGRGIRIQFVAGTCWKGPTDVDSNTAGVAARAVLDLLDYPDGVCLEIEKGIVPASGSGSSAASAVAAAWAVNELFGNPLSTEELVPPVLKGESVASGSVHGDNVIPALLGGVVLVSAENPEKYSVLPVAEGLLLSVILPSMEIATREAREILPESVALTDAVRNASNLAFLVDSLQRGDWRSFGRQVMSDLLVEPVRSNLLPAYNSIKEAALSSGAFGCALSGSGPTMFAVSDSANQATITLAAMVSACEDCGIDASGIVSPVGRTGARTCATS
jgi:homoserine kinase